MDTEELFKRIEAYLSDTNSIYILNQIYKKKIKESIELIKCHINTLDQEKEITEYNPEIIKSCIQYLQILITELPSDQLFNQFCFDYCFLVQNWNNNVLNDDELTSKINFIVRKTNNEITFFEARDILKHLTTRLEKQLQWRPPAFELSDHYYKLLKEK